MLMRARQAAAAPQKLHRPAALPLPLPAAARPSLPYTAPAASSTAAHHMAPGTSNPAAARPAALMSAPAQPQSIPAASLQIATVLAAQPVRASHSAAPAAATTAAHAYAAHHPVVAAAASHGMTTSGAGLVSFVPQLSQLLRPQVMQQDLLGENSPPPPQQTQLAQRAQQAQQAQHAQQAHQAQQAQQAQQATVGWSSLPGSGLHPSNTQLGSMPLAAAAVAAPMRAGSTLASLLPGQPATAPVYPPATVATNTAAVAGSGRGLRLMHKASLDVLRLKLRLVDLVQGCPALQPKVSRCMPARVSLQNLHHIL